MAASIFSARVARVAALALALAAWLNVPAAAQQKRLTLDDLFDPERRVDFTSGVEGGLTWIDDGRLLQARRNPQTRLFDLLKVDAATGTTTPLFDAQRMEAALAKLPGVSADEARRLSHQREYTMNPGRTTTLLTIGGDLYAYTFGEDAAARLTFADGEEEEVTYSPNGALVGFVRKNNLYVVDPATRREWALTSDGREGRDQILNGKLDWVYEEEVYGRGTHRAYWWSPDSSRIAFLQIDDTPSPEFTVVDHIPYRLGLEVYDYPKAGDRNPTAKLAVVRAAGGAVRWIDAAKYSANEHLIVNVDWAPDSRRVAFQVQNREQTWLDLNLGDATSGESRTLFRETTKAWVSENGPPTWLKDGTFLWFSERSGWKHLYRYNADGALRTPITSGQWEARTLHGVDESAGLIYFSGTERSPIGGDVYRIKLDGTSMTRLSQSRGTHAATFNPAMTQFVDVWSDINTPPQTRLHRADGAEVRVIDAGRVPALAEYRLSKSELLQVKTRDGFVMEAMMLKPPDFDPSRRYPVYQHTYGGPHAPQVADRWPGATGMFHQMLAQQGIIVWICDNRTASGKGAESAWAGYKRLGETELRDIEDGVAWLKQQPYVDASRIGINGWSYGGFMVSYALTHSKSFTMGIAGGTVSDWRDYDSIYTERLMDTPQANPDGYRKSSPRWAAKDLTGKLLLVHGTMDDNVHMQNTLQFAYELQQAGKPFSLMLYPKSRHGVSDPLLVKHMRTMMYNFILETLKPDGAGKPVTTAAR